MNSPSKGATQQATPDPAHFIHLCRTALPELLEAECHVDPGEAKAVGEDVLARAEAFAALDRSTQDTLVAPFVEEAYHHLPDEASVWLKAAVVVVVRNSRLEDLHARQLVDAAMVTSITTAAAGSLSHLLAARRRQSMPAEQATVGDSPFADLDLLYPRAWACLTALAEALDRDGGRHGYRMPDARVPTLPRPDEQVEAELSEMPGAVVLSAIDERFDQNLMQGFRQASEGGLPVFVPGLSRFSRNGRKLLRVLEFLLAHKAVIVTTNYMLRANDVWVRKGELARPDSRDRYSGLTETKGLSGAHGRAVEQLLKVLKAQDEASG